jgi:hypothetical protein
MDGMDEDIDLFGIWPREFLDPARLPGNPSATLPSAPMSGGGD